MDDYDDDDDVEEDDDDADDDYDDADDDYDTTDDDDYEISSSSPCSFTFEKSVIEDDADKG